MRQRGDSKDIRLLNANYCWVSGMAGNQPAKNWFGPWYLQIAHIASGGAKAVRVDDRRAVCLLSPLVHDCHVSNSEAFPEKTICGVTYPTIDERHMLWVKQQVDPEYYDPEYLQSIWVGALPEPQPPCQYWNDIFFNNTYIIRAA